MLIWYQATYTNFDLTFEWKVSKAGNSGVFYNVEETSTHESGNGNSPNWLDNFEMQLLGDIDFNDKEPKRSAGSLYDLIAPQNKIFKTRWRIQHRQALRKQRACRAMAERRESGGIRNRIEKVERFDQQEQV